MFFPRELDPEYFDLQYRRQPETWREPFLRLWRDNGPPADRNANFQPFKDGSNLIAAMGEVWVMKVFPPFLRHQWVSEYRVLQHLDGQLSLPIPRFFKAGEEEDDDEGGWTYIIMSRLSGNTLETVWPRLPEDDKVAVLRDIGSIMARAQSLPVGTLTTLPPDWKEFLSVQMQGCRARHQRHGMPPWFVNGVDDLVRESWSLIPDTFEPVLLTGEYTPFNLLVDDKPRVQSIAGMIDFGDAMTGFGEYDLLGPLLFSCEGKGYLVNALLEGYGITPEGRDKTLRRRLFLLQILHRYSYFKGQVRIPNWEKQVHTLEELENLIWPLG